MTSFPIDNFIFEKIIEVFTKTRSYVLLLFPLVFLLRIAFNFIMFKNVDDFINLLKDSLLLTLGLYFFGDLLKFALQVPYFTASELSLGEMQNIKLSGGFFSNKFKYITDLIGIVCYWISFGLYVLTISLLGFFSAYIIFIGTMFRFYGLLRVFTLLIFVASLWPLIWHSINFSVMTIAVSDNAFSNNVVVSSASIAKVIFPLWILSKSSKIPQILTGSKSVALSSNGLLINTLNRSKNLLVNSSQKKDLEVFFHKEQSEELSQNHFLENDFSIKEDRNHQIVLNEEREDRESFQEQNLFKNEIHQDDNHQETIHQKDFTEDKKINEHEKVSEIEKENQKQEEVQDETLT